MVKMSIMRQAARWVTAMVVAVAFAGCTDGVTPRLLELRYDGQAPDASPVLLFTLVFEDDDGDLGEGQLETLIDNQASGLAPLELAPLFVRADVPLTSTAGEVPFAVELAVGRDPSGWPDAGTELIMGARALDGAENLSNVAEVRLVLR